MPLLTLSNTAKKTFVFQGLGHVNHEVNNDVNNGIIDFIMVFVIDCSVGLVVRHQTTRVQNLHAFTMCFELPVRLQSSAPHAACLRKAEALGHDADKRRLGCRSQGLVISGRQGRTFQDAEHGQLDKDFGRRRAKENH